MDCEKLDELAIDFVYGDETGEARPAGSPHVAELDPRAIADAEEHLLGCTRCRALVDRLRAGKKAAESLVLETPPSLLESRILEAAAKASKSRAPAPWPRRFARAISTAGSYAMRPQVAMAAVVVMMVGMSIVLLRGGSLTAHQTKVTEEGTPVASVEKNHDDQGAMATLADEEKPRKEAEAQGGAIAAAPGAMPSSAAASTATAMAAANGKDQSEDGLAELEKKDEAKANDKSHAGDDLDQAADLPADGKKGGVGASGGAAGPMPAPAAAAKSVAAPSSPTFDAAMDAYTKGSFADAAKGFDAAAAAGTRPSTSTLYAARSYRAAGSCGEAFPRFQKILSTWPSSAEVPWAALEGGECARALGDDATAKTLLEKAATYPATKARAESNLASMKGASSAKPPSGVMASPKKKASPDNAVDSY